jgi:diacylglycerol kinase (ATP)
MSNENFSIQKRMLSFSFAWAGIKQLLRSEHNTRIHLAATVLVIIAAIYFRLSPVENCAIILAIGLVWITEAFNTCVEKMMDFISTERRSEIKLIKDVAAAGVLIAAIIAFLTGLIIFLPKIITV